MSAKQGQPSPQAPVVHDATRETQTAVPEKSVEVEDTAGDVRHSFRLEDWLAGLVTTLFSGLIFFYYMAPEVTLQDSGELVTGSFTFGVPHPPGYPLWAFLGFVWSHVIVPFGNPAWRLGTLSVVTGALTVGLLTITMTRSLRLLLHSLPWARVEDEKLYRWMALTIGTSTALLFGFNRGVWLWSSVSEMRVLNQFSFMLMTCTFLAWMMQPQRRGPLYATLFLYALSFANHQTVAVMAVPFAVGAFAVGLEQFIAQRASTRREAPFWPTFMPCLSTFWELATAGLLVGMVGLGVMAWLVTPPSESITAARPFAMAIAGGLAGLAGLAIGKTTGWWSARRALLCAGLLLAGASFYLYMPLAASTNPPMNWGYAATKDGFWHAVSRGQYEKMAMANVFGGDFLLKIDVFAQGVMNQYSWPLCLLVLGTLICMAWGLWHRYGRDMQIIRVLGYTLVGGLPLLLLIKHVLDVPGPFWIVMLWNVVLAASVCLVLGAWHFFKPRGRSWMVFLWTAFMCASLGLLIIINPKIDRQEQEITIKFFAPAHGFYAMLIGYGIAVILSLIAARGPRWSGAVVQVACVGLLALPMITYQRNWSLCALRGHDFGYLFGYLMFEPGGGYPAMEKDAVLYGGTDPGRFVPTYMIFCESRVAPEDKFRDRTFDRSDVYIITQNALADPTYMSYIRDHYDYSRPKNDGTLQRMLGRDHTYPREAIYIPSVQDSGQAFRQYVDDVESGRRPRNADLKVENGRVSVSGALGVMEINGILAQWIFERNRDKHAFYVEESYVIPWMYPYLRPAGVIMKLEKDPLPSPQQDAALWTNIVARDKAYWDKLTGEFLLRPDFKRNNDAKKSFSKLRSAIAGLYAARQMVTEAEYAFKQSLQLCPESPEANFRLAELYMQLRRYAEARDLIETYQRIDIYNVSAGSYLNNIRSFEKQDQRRQELEKQMGQGRIDINTALELDVCYLRLSMEADFQRLTHSLLQSTNVPSSVYLAVAQLCGNGRRWDLFAVALRRYLQFEPRDFKAWIDLAFAELAQNRPDDSMHTLRQATTVGGEAARSILREDKRFAPLYNRADFRALVPPPPQLDPRLLPLGF